MRGHHHCCHHSQPFFQRSLLRVEGRLRTRKVAQKCLQLCVMMSKAKAGHSQGQHRTRKVKWHTLAPRISRDTQMYTSNSATSAPNHPLATGPLIWIDMARRGSDAREAALRRVMRGTTGPTSTVGVPVEVNQVHEVLGVQH